MKKIINKVSIVVMVFLFAITATSCLDDEAVDFGNGPIVVQFPSASATKNFLQDGTGIVYDYEVPVQYFGGDNSAPLNKDVTITVAVNAEKTTATDGVEYSLTQTEFTIPAGSTSAMVTVKVNSDNLDAFDPKVLALEITSSSEKASSNKNVIELTLQGICPSALAGNFTYANGRPATVTETGSGTYTVSVDDYFRGEYSFNISDVCDQLTVTGGYLQDNFNIPVSGSGSVSNGGNTLTIVYTAEGYFSNRTMVLTRD